MIAENVLSQWDPDGFETKVMDCIVDHDHKRDDSADPMSEKYFKLKQGVKTERNTTVGWQFLVKWRNRNQDWVQLSDLKGSNPVDMAEHATVRGVEREPVCLQ